MRKVPWWVWVSAAVVVVAVVVGVLGVAASNRGRNEAFLNALDNDSTTDVGELPDAQLLETFHRNCEQIADGWTLDDEMDAASRNWMSVSSAVTESEYRANVRALFTASMGAC